MQSKLRQNSEAKIAVSAKEDGTTQVLMKFQEQLALKDVQMIEMQQVSKKKMGDLEKQLAATEKKSASEINKLNAKLNKQESLVVKYFGVENEMISLRSAILAKDHEINSLKSHV